jgi:hypothetical protein
MRRRKIVSTWAKSTVRIVWACKARNCRHVGPDRRGAGSSPAYTSRLARLVEPGGAVDRQLLRMLDELTGARVGSRYASYRLT